MTGTLINTAPLHALLEAAPFVVPAVLLFVAVLGAAHRRHHSDRGGFYS